MTDAAPARFWLQDQLGFDIERGEGSARATIVCDDRHLNPHGAVHGAVVYALVDTAMGAATMSVLDESSWCATIEIQQRYLAPVFSGPLVADVSVVKAGRRIVHLDARVVDGDGRLVATAAGSYAVIPRPTA
ncbi:MAG: PaaI family thioesterase [Acidimicrobiales bacterium]|nr:PaaI family thioesterase [Acidimicrobiales bacterium]